MLEASNLFEYFLESRRVDYGSHKFLLIDCIDGGKANGIKSL